MPGICVLNLLPNGWPTGVNSDTEVDTEVRSIQSSELVEDDKTPEQIASGKALIDEFADVFAQK